MPLNTCGQSMHSCVFILGSTGMSRTTKKGSSLTVNGLSNLYIKLIKGPSQSLCCQMSDVFLMSFCSHLLHFFKFIFFLILQCRCINESQDKQFTPITLAFSFHNIVHIVGVFCCLYMSFKSYYPGSVLHGTLSSHLYLCNVTAN